MKTTLIEKLPDYKKMIFNCIKSSETEQQLDVCEDFISLFRDRYLGLISRIEWGTHCIELNTALETRRKAFTKSSCGDIRAIHSFHS